jgi:hypothetical protein
LADVEGDRAGVPRDAAASGLRWVGLDMAAGNVLGVYDLCMVWKTS